jgi:hypothetical protein
VNVHQRASGWRRECWQRRGWLIRVRLWRGRDSVVAVIERQSVPHRTKLRRCHVGLNLLSILVRPATGGSGWRSGDDGGATRVRKAVTGLATEGCNLEVRAMSSNKTARRSCGPT